MNKWVINSTLSLLLVSGTAFAVPHPPAKAAASPTDEESLMSRLQPDGFIDFNDYRRQANGGAILQAINGDNGRLETIMVAPTGKVSMEPGWQLTQPPTSSSSSPS